MPVLRQRHARNFTTLPNELLQDPRLTCGDLGLLVQMLSRPENWDFSTSSLTALYAGRAGKDGGGRYFSMSFSIWEIPIVWFGFRF